MKYTIDRIEQNIAICEAENGQMIEINTSDLPNNIKEGNIIVKSDSGYILDEKNTNEKKAEIRKRINNLWK